MNFKALTSAQIRAARALIRWSAEDLARESSVGLTTIRRAELTDSETAMTTANDLAIWNNNLHKGKILKPESYQLIIKPTALSQHNFFGKEKEGYGYSIRIIEKEAVKYIGHTGLGDGFSSVNLYFPESDVSLIVMENQMNESSDLFYASEFKIKNLLLKSDLLRQK